ncbi:hypothetical protein [Pseudomonas fitomaticsae]|uniref:Uncharacterized protein n=1 Tax=Pseudomonas fitomaticsae TaxID=2837969 RepID=A0ABY3PW65_9PSED|nr:hypothetical protein [Pseudomonas fitomaticsae]UFP98010.1 hypothetical protein KJY40_18320 [Pseudomonas fitomaticsae]
MATALKTVIVQQAKFTYDTLDAEYDRLYESDVHGRAHLKAMLGSARDAYWKAERDDLRDDNLYVKTLIGEIKTANSGIKTAIETQKKTTELIALFSEAVKLVAAVVALAAA